MVPNTYWAFDTYFEWTNKPGTVDTEGIKMDIAWCILKNVQFDKEEQASIKQLGILGPDFPEKF